MKPDFTDDEANDPLLTSLRQHLGNYGQAPPPGTWAAIRQQLPPPRRRRQLLPLLGLLLGLLVAGSLAGRYGGHSKGVRAAFSHRSPALVASANSPAPGVKPTNLPKQPDNRPLVATGSQSNNLAPAAATSVPRQPVAPATPTQAAVRRSPDSWATAATSSERTPSTHRRAYAPLAQAAAGADEQRHQLAYTITPPRFQSARQQLSYAHPKQALRAPGSATKTPGATKPAPSESLVAASPVQYAVAVEGAAVEELLPRRATLAVAPVGLPTLLAARLTSPAATPLAEAAGRRWSLQVLAGPTYSYRQLGTPVLRRSLAPLERPALGLGVQAQARRVLADRWALAVGLGYHEYATRLSLDADSGLAFVPFSNRRDVYRLLTLPVQISYALGTSRKRLATAVLVGIEPGWFLSGLSTENTSSPYEQQHYSLGGSTSQSSWNSHPYRAWNLAFSLGFDLRYRLGKPESRWHLVVQPTGRYVVTPFVQDVQIGIPFAQRHPFSLGLFAGLSCDL